MFDGFELRTVADSLFYQIRAEPFIAGVFAAQTQEWDAGIYQHLADFIHGSVGITPVSYTHLDVYKRQGS